jgi:hypothetical protein
MLLFRSEEAVADWCRAEGRERGGVVAIDALQRLAARWYGDRLDPGWRPRSREASQAILDETGLTGPFWRLP